MDIKTAIYTRRAVRNYTAQSIDKAKLRALIDAAVQAPSAVNRQPWAFSVVRDKSLLERISQAAKAHMLRTSPAALLSHHFLDILNDPKFNIFYNAPVLIVISSVEEGAWAVEDCALAAENLMLAARAAELGTCWIGFAQAWLRTDEGKVALQVPANYFPVAPIIVGHPESMPAPVARREPVIKWIGA